MKKLIGNSRTLLVMGIGFAMVGSAIAAGVPNTFTSGDTIKASEMNENFMALEESISTISLTPGPAGEFTIRDAGNYAGQVGFGNTGDFSFLLGAGGATGVAAANAACDAAFPGSHAELDLLVLWEAAINSNMPAPNPAYGYWASTVTSIPISLYMRFLPRTTDCDNWSNGASGQTGIVRPTIGTSQVDVYMDTQGCAATNMAVACFVPQ